MHAADTPTVITLPGTKGFPRKHHVVEGRHADHRQPRSRKHFCESRLEKPKRKSGSKPGTGGLNSILGTFSRTKKTSLLSGFARTNSRTRVKRPPSKHSTSKRARPRTRIRCLVLKRCATTSQSPTTAPPISATRNKPSSLCWKAWRDRARRSGKRSSAWLHGVDGLAFGDKTTLYVNSFTTNKFARLDIGPDDKATKVVESWKTSRPLGRPDGMRHD